MGINEIEKMILRCGIANGYKYIGRDNNGVLGFSMTTPMGYDPKTGDLIYDEEPKFEEIQYFHSKDLFPYLKTDKFGDFVNIEAALHVLEYHQEIIQIYHKAVNMESIYFESEDKAEDYIFNRIKNNYELEILWNDNYYSIAKRKEDGLINIHTYKIY